MNNIPTLENWYIGARNDPYAAPECIDSKICGTIYNHPDIPDGEFIAVSIAVDYDIDNDELICISRRYKLGQVDKQFEKAYPNAKNRLIDHILLNR